MVAEEERRLRGCLACSCISVVPAFVVVRGQCRHALIRAERSRTCGTWMAARGPAAPAGGRFIEKLSRHNGGLSLRRGGIASLYAAQPGERGSTLPCSHSLRSLGGSGLLGLICAVLSALLVLHPVFCGVKRLAFCALPLFCPVTTQLSSVLAGRAKRQKKALLR